MTLHRTAPAVALEREIEMSLDRLRPDQTGGLISARALLLIADELHDLQVTLGELLVVTEQFSKTAEALRKADEGK